ncbi:plan Homeodomain finger of tumor Supressor Ing4 [Ochromonadaceae sp. CCMP2298]|nr:plan Homeodomain finger of tumor Supressor Ing4 [Ochromonadaceae sp. CCMP2298]
MDPNIDPNEPVYCVCNRIAFGDMIACDNEECPIEWFHYTCVNLTRKPRNSWICPTCSYRKKK